jgi:ATP-dependent RNA helicase DeaD
MLDMGFAEDIEAILQETPEERQTVLFSATLPPRIEGITGRYLREPVRIQMGREAPAPGEAPKVRQEAYVVGRAHKPAALGRLLDVESPTAAIVFCRTREEVDQLTESLNGSGYRAEALHGGMSQEQRDRVMGRLRNGTAELLIATDVAARGLDIEQLTHVVNYNVPSASESYVHRIGRVGRAGREGVAITLAEPREHRMLKAIERQTKQRITVQKIPTVADLRARRLELTRAALHESLLEDDLEQFLAVVEPLADEFDVMEVALAAVKLAYDSSGATVDESEIPEVSYQPGRDGRDRRDGGRRERRSRGPAEGMTRLFVGAGRSAGIRPQDLVGAIAGESRLSGRDIGTIEIADRFSLVEIPERAADDVIKALRKTSIKGRKPTVRRERDAAPRRPR